MKKLKDSFKLKSGYKLKNDKDVEEKKREKLKNIFEKNFKKKYYV